MKTFLLILIGLLASIGLGCALAALQRWILRPKKPCRVALVVPVAGGEEDIEYTLRSASASLLASGKGGVLLIADFGADPQTLNICRMYCGGSPGARMCRGEDLPTVLKAYANAI